MPRTGRGGARQGQVGELYPNRSDLRAAVPVATAPGQTYGARSAEQAAQRVVPVSQPAGPATGAPVPTSSPSPAPELPSGGPPTSPAPQGPMPGEMPFLHPTQRPGEPLTAGLPRGPGPGPEVLQGIGAVASQMSDEATSAKALLSALAGRPGASSTIRDLAGAAGAVLPRG